jgi:hypothetical protein
MELLKSAVASTVTALGMQGAAAEPTSEPNNVPARSRVTVSTEFKQGCELLFGQCTGNRQTEAVRFGDSTKASELVIGITKFSESTAGGFGRVYPITLRGRELGAVDYGLYGHQQLSGTVVSVDKYFPLSSFGVASVGGYVGTVDGAIGARADLGLTVKALDKRFGVSAEYNQERSAKFGGLKEAAVAFIPTPHANSFIAVNQYAQAGIEKMKTGVGVGVVYLNNPEDKQRLRPDGCATTAFVPRGIVVALNVCAEKLLRNPLGDKSEEKLGRYADTINQETAILNKVNYAPPQVTAAQLGSLVGYEREPQRNTNVQLRMVVPVGKNGAVTGVLARSSTGRSSSSLALSYNF